MVGSYGWRWPRALAAGITLLVSSGLWGCATTEPTARESKADRCVSGDCKDGYGVSREPRGKYVLVSTGTFKDGKLWDGKVEEALGNMDAIIIGEVSDGKIVWARTQGH